MASEEYDNPVALQTVDLGLKEQLLCKGYKNTAMTPDGCLVRTGSVSP
jgi:hypothetical protein